MQINCFRYTIESVVGKKELLDITKGSILKMWIYFNILKWTFKYLEIYSLVIENNINVVGESQLKIFEI